MADENAESLLLGAWRTDPDDDWSLRTFGHVSMRFSGDGTLEYSIDAGGKRQIMRLTFRVDGEWLVTNQPSAPREDRVRFVLVDRDRLSLLNPPPMQPSRYVRV